jgi:hypothetical protein
METDKDLFTPEIGKTCPALTNENYEYHLSGDCRPFCICSLNDQPCKGRVIDDPEDRTSQFFSRAKCMMSKEGLNSCPVYGSSLQVFELIIKEKAEKQLQSKLNNLKK